LFLGATRKLDFEESIKTKSRIIRQLTDDDGFAAQYVHPKGIARAAEKPRAQSRLPD